VFILLLATFLIKSMVANHNRVTKVSDRAQHFPFPKILHQMHKSRAQLSPLERTLTERCREVNADFQYSFWDDEAMETFVALRYPEHHGWWSVMKPFIKKVDTSRYLLMHHYGGVYIDVDVDCLNPISLFAKDLPRGTAWLGGYPEPFQLMSDVNHAFWLHMIDSIHKTLENADAWTSTGPSGLNDAATSYVRLKGRDVLMPWRTHRSDLGWVTFAGESNMSVPWFVDNLHLPDDKRTSGHGTALGFWPNQVVDPGACAQSKLCENDSCREKWPDALYAHRCTGTWRTMQ
jgi:hypothetical protein